MGRHSTWVGAVVGLSLLIAACSIGAPSPSASSPSGVQGVLYRANTQKGGVPYAPRPLIPASGTLKVFHTDSHGYEVGDEVTHVSVDTSGRFRILLSPGRYRIEAEGSEVWPTLNPVGETDSFEVRLGGFVQVKVTMAAYLP
jgi:methyl coenzyme M reductase subunit D